jgi:ABC-type branched-subunit amino acid transport system permease subunit
MAFVTGFTEYWPMAIGSIIILVVLFMPGGVLGIILARFKSSPAKPGMGGAAEP